MVGSVTFKSRKIQNRPKPKSKGQHPFRTRVPKKRLAHDPYSSPQTMRRNLAIFRSKHPFSRFLERLSREESGLDPTLISQVYRALIEQGEDSIILERFDVKMIADAFKGENDLSRMVSCFRIRDWNSGWNVASSVLLGKPNLIPLLVTTYRGLSAPEISRQIDGIFVEAFSLPEGSRISNMGQGRNAHLLNVLAPGFILSHPELIEELVNRVSPFVIKSTSIPAIKAAILVFLNNLLDLERWYADGRNKEVYIGWRRSIARGHRSGVEGSPHYFFDLHPETA